MRNLLVSSVLFPSPCGEMVRKVGETHEPRSFFHCFHPLAGKWLGKTGEILCNVTLFRSGFHPLAGKWLGKVEFLHAKCHRFLC